MDDLEKKCMIYQKYMNRLEWLKNSNHHNHHHHCISVPLIHLNCEFPIFDNRLVVPHDLYTSSDHILAEPAVN